MKIWNRLRTFVGRRLRRFCIMSYDAAIDDAAELADSLRVCSHEYEEDVGDAIRELSREDT